MIHDLPDLPALGYAIRLYQVLPGPQYRIWNVFGAWSCQTDLALLHLGLERTTTPGELIQWKQPRLRVLAPPVGHKVIAFGYRDSKIEVRANDDGSHHIDLQDQPTTSIGEITAVYPNGRDKAMLPFPCFEVAARFDAGMSGGMVMDENGSLCGVVCASLQTADPLAQPISYVTSLWPMLTTIIWADRGDRYPRGAQYPVIDLAIDGILVVSDLGDLDPAHFPGKTLPGVRRA